LLDVLATDPAATDAVADPELGRLAAVAERLRAADGATPRPEFRAALRTRLVELAAAQPAPAADPATAVLEPTADAPDTGPEPGPEPPADPVRLPARWRRPRLSLVAASLALLAVASTAVLSSRNALPGDPLYALKRGTEQAGLALARGDEGRGLRYLQLARTRAGEVRDLAGRRGAGPAALIDTLGMMDQQTAAGVRLLTTAAVRQVDDAPLVTVGTWTKQQYDLLVATISQLPAGTMARLGDSIMLLRRVADRVVALRSRLGCSCLATVAPDDLGPWPCTPCDAARAPASSSPSGPSRPGPSHPAAPTRTAAPGGGAGGSGASPSVGGESSSSSGGGLPLPIPLPTGGGTSVPLPSIPGLPLPTELPLPLPLPPLPLPPLPLPPLPLPPLPSLPLPTGLLPGLLPGSGAGG
jgi:hypothetical protein